MLKKNFVVIICICLILSVVSFASAETIKIGVPGPFTGPAALLGNKMKAAAVLAAEEINAQGGLLGKKIELVFGDTESSPEKGLAVFERFATKDKVDAIVGEFHGSVCLAESGVAEKYGIPNITVGVVTEKVTQQGYKTIFRIDLRSRDFANYQTDFVKNFLIPAGITRYACLAENSDWGRDMANLYPKVLKDTKAELVESDIVELGTMNFYSQLTNFKGGKVEAVFCAVTGSSCYPIITQAAELGFSGLLIFAIPEPQFPEAIKICGEDLNIRTLNLAMFAAGNAISEKSIPFCKAYYNKYGEDPSYIAALHYDAMYVYFDAVKRAGSFDKEKVLDALHDTDYEYTLVRGAHMKFDAEGNLTPRAFITQVQNGKTIILWPEEFASGKLELFTK
jgi:branched-chain amino acid transport system substrate-binding protein